MSISWLNSCETSHFLVDGKYPRGLQRNKYKGAFLQANPHLTLNLVISWRNSCGKNMLLQNSRKRNMAAVRSQSQGRDCTWSNKVAYHKSLTIVEPGLEVYIYFRKCVQSSNVLFNPRLKFVARTSMFWKEEFISANRLYFKHVLWNNLETAFRSAVASAVTSAWVGHRTTAGP